MSIFAPIYHALTLIGVPILSYFFYTLVMALMGFKSYKHYEPARPRNRFAAVVAARNESNVVGHLIDSIKQARYPSEMLDIWVIPNNCTDNTAQVALDHGAKIFEPTVEIRSKGAALKNFFDFIVQENDDYDAFCIFDADNLVDPNFFNVMNDALESGESVAQGYRESKNPKDSWISGSQSMFYWITNRFLNMSKRNYGLSAVLNGTGFMVSRQIIENQGFNTYTLTEDIEFSTQCILNGYKVAFIKDAVTYDEHPVDFDTSWKQRKRWSTGILQTLYMYAPRLFRNFIKTKDWVNIDMILYLAAPYFQVLGFLYTLATLSIYGAISYYSGYAVSSFSFSVFVNTAGIAACLLYTLFVAKFENHKIRDCKLSTYFSFYWFITTWTFINIEVFFNPITSWEPIEHKKTVTINEMTKLTAQKEF